MCKDWNVPTSSTRALRVWNSVVLEHFSVDSRKRIETVHAVWMRIDRSMFDLLSMRFRWDRKRILLKTTGPRGRLNFIRLPRVVTTPSVTSLLRGENDSKQSDEFQARPRGRRGAWDSVHGSSSPSALCKLESANNNSCWQCHVQKLPKTSVHPNARKYIFNEANKYIIFIFAPRHLISHSDPSSFIRTCS